MLLLLSVSVQGARVDTTWVDSPSMKKKVEVIYVVPDKALGENPQACPVVYLLHGCLLYTSPSPRRECRNLDWHQAGVGEDC